MKPASVLEFFVSIVILKVTTDGTTKMSENSAEIARTKLAEILAKATAVLGSKEDAEQWLEKPAIGLDQRKPMDLLATPAGVEMVEDYLGRLEYGVYT